MPKSGDTIGPYSLISKLGRGAFGVVWLAEKRTTITTTRVAIKIPNDDEIDLEAVRQEASLWVHASGHPNVLPIIDADIHEGQVIIVSEYAPDGSLSKWLEKHGGKAPSIESARDMSLGILAGLEHLHERGIIHRDLKPDNVLLQKETPRLADFGIARILKTTSNSTIATGTPAYMPPEAFDGKRSEQTDIWSVGVVFYQLLAGKLPFPQEEFTSLVGAVLTREPDPLPDSVPTQLQRIIKRALEKEPMKRFESARDMRNAIRSAALSEVGTNNNVETKVLTFDGAEFQRTTHLSPPKEVQPTPTDNSSGKPGLPNTSPNFFENEHERKTSMRARYFGAGFLALLISIIAFVYFTDKPRVTSPTVNPAIASPDALPSATPEKPVDNVTRKSEDNSTTNSDPTRRVVVSNQINQYETKLAQLRQKRAQLLLTYTPAWPEVKQVDIEIADLERKLSALRSGSSR